MQQTLLLEGTWTKVQERTARLAGHHANERVGLIVVAVDAPALPIAGPNASAQGMNEVPDALADANRHLPVLPLEAFERESLYEDKW